MRYTVGLLGLIFIPLHRHHTLLSTLLLLVEVLVADTLVAAVAPEDI
jgi:hypothetical protein